uniref:Carboxypeptidase n=1 Tax=Hadrurus spadix TaxID=141984 RepID=A0A1W7RAV1_9SCOR
MGVFAVILLCGIVCGISTVNGKEAWSYVNVRPDAYIFWWLYYADVGEQNYSKYPLIIWLQGGPGASSTGYGNFMEIGPQDVNLNPRNTTWAKVANLLFIDNPVGAGFSYVGNKSALCTNNTQIAQDLVVVMRAFFQKVPEFQNVPLYIFSESYGGKMAVSFSKILYKTIESGKLKCKFSGVALGDSWISPYSSVSTWGEYLYSVSFLDQTGLQSVNSVVKEIKTALEKKQFDNATILWKKAQDDVEALTNGVDWYNILRDVGPVNFSTTEKLPKDHPLYRMYQRHVGYLSDSLLDKLMNGAIKKKLHIIPKNVTWGGQSADVFTALQTDFMKPVVDEVDYLLNRTHLKVIIYNGQLDLIVDTIGTLSWMDELKWPGLKSFKQANRSPFLLPSNRTAGFVKSYKNLYFYWILKSGHMVPADAGRSALKMLELILGKK